MKKILVRVDKDGKVTFEAQGFGGMECLEATEPFEKVIGGEVVDRKMKDFEDESKERLSLGN